jgi:alpha-glucosidase
MAEWWRNAVFYEIYVRSFADADGDGVGDLEGIRARLPYVRELGVDAIWLTPFYPSPGADHGYDVADYTDVDPQFGTLEGFDRLIAEAHALGLRVVVDVVPNHTSIEHEWFVSGDRDRYLFRPGRDGGPPNNWVSVFGGPAWTFHEESGEYYLHLFAPEQPDLNWRNPAVRRDLEDVLRFWLDRGVDGFRIDVAHGLFKDERLRDEPGSDDLAVAGTDYQGLDQRHAVDQPEVHDVYRRWRELADGYGDERVLVGEVFLYDPVRVADYVRPDELQLAFNFLLLPEPWRADRLRAAIDRTLAELGRVGAPATWVLENHDVTRLPTRYGGGELGRRRARAASMLLLALPGAAFVYAGQELGLEEVELPDDALQDPIFRRSGGTHRGRDGCRVPLPWTRELPQRSWLPVPAAWADLSVAEQERDPASPLELHRTLLRHRRGSTSLRDGGFAWLAAPDGVLAFARSSSEERVVCVVNVDGEPFEPPQGEVWARSSGEGPLKAGEALWLRA